MLDFTANDTRKLVNRRVLLKRKIDAMKKEIDQIDSDLIATGEKEFIGASATLYVVGESIYPAFDSGKAKAILTASQIAECMVERTRKAHIRAK